MGQEGREKGLLPAKAGIWSQGFAAAVADLYLSLQPFAEVVTEWQPREISVQIFGH